MRRLTEGDFWAIRERMKKTLKCATPDICVECRNSLIADISIILDGFISDEIDSDAPTCASCGDLMTRTGSCYTCRNCGETSGCS